MAEQAVFISKKEIYDNDYNCIMRSAKSEFAHSLHYHDFYEVQIYLGSGGIFHIDNSEYLVRRGDIVLIDMFKPHTLVYNKDTNYERFCIDINLNLLTTFSTSNSNLMSIFHHDANDDLIYHLTEEQLQKYLVVFDHYRSLNLRKGQDILEKAIVHQLLAYIYSDCYRGKTTSSLDNQHMVIVSNILNYINNHLSEEISLATLAKEVNYSEYYVCRLFRKITGVTLTNYIQEKRIKQACMLLRTYESVNQAAEATGFNNYSYFYKTFKKIVGCSPAEYQAKYKKKAEK